MALSGRRVCAGFAIIGTVRHNRLLRVFGLVRTVCSRVEIARLIRSQIIRAILFLLADMSPLNSQKKRISGASSSFAAFARHSSPTFFLSLSLLTDSLGDPKSMIAQGRRPRNSQSKKFQCWRRACGT